MGIKNFVLKMFSPSDEASFGRVMSFIAFMACIGWDAFFVGFAAHRLDFGHMSIHDILPTGDQLRDQAIFCASTYGITKVSDLTTLITSIWKK